MSLKAVIFDVDGTIAETERDGHRVAFNRAFEAFGLEDCWDEEFYGELLQVSGGQERLKYYLDTYRTSENVGRDHQQMASAIHKLKNSALIDIIENLEILPRPGIIRLMDELYQAGITIAIATTGSRVWVEPLLKKILGSQRWERLCPVVTGDDVDRKKPDPQTYEIALFRLGITASEAIAIEDSRNGLLSAFRAEISCVITPSSYLKKDDYSEAALVVNELGDPGESIQVISSRYEISVDTVVSLECLQKLAQAVKAG